MIVCNSNTDRESWLKARERYIGASDLAAILSASPWSSPYSLWAEKTERVERRDLSNSEPVEWGHRLEPVILAAYGDRTHRTVQHSGDMIVDTRWPWLAATLDGWTSDGQGGRHPLEIKAIGPWSAEEWEGGCPDHYRIQVHAQMMVTDSNRATIAALIGGQRLVWQDIERDDELVRRIEAAGPEFLRMVQMDEAPPVDAHRATKSVLDRMHPADSGETVNLSADFIDLADDLANAKEAKKEAEKRAKAIEARIKQELGDASFGALPDGRTFSWKTQERAAQVVKASSFRVLRISKARRAA